MRRDGGTIAIRRANAQKALERHFQDELGRTSNKDGYYALAFYTLKDETGRPRDHYANRYDTSIRMLPPDLYPYADRTYEVDDVLRGNFSQPLSTGAKVGIGAGIVGVIGAIWALARGSKP